MNRLALLLVLVGCGAATHMSPPPPPSEFDVTADDGLACHVYLTSEGPRPTTLIFWLGGTGSGSNARLPPELRRPDVAVLTFDKPGVRAPFDHPDAVQITDTSFARYTQGTLLSCARSALAAARARLAPARIILRGHSEGTLILLGLALEPAVVGPVRAIVLSGLPLEPFAVLLRRQLATRPALAHAISSCDWPAMKQLVGVSCAYLADAAARPSGRELVERLAAHQAPELDVFAGAEDDLTPARFVTDLETWNTARGHLDLHVHRYAGGHAGSPDARREMAALIDRLAR